MSRLLRPLDKVLYQPIRTQNARQQAARTALVEGRMAASSVRPEKRNGLVRSQRTAR